MNLSDTHRKLIQAFVDHLETLPLGKDKIFTYRVTIAKHKKKKTYDFIGEELLAGDHDLPYVSISKIENLLILEEQE